MYKIFRIIFTVLSAVCIAFVIPVGMLFDLTWACIVGLGAGVFFLAMLLCKQAQEQKEPPKTDEAEQNPTNSEPDA